MDPTKYPAKGTGFPHIIRDDKTSYIDYTRVGGPLVICTLRGSWRDWGEASDHVFAHIHHTTIPLPRAIDERR